MSTTIHSDALAHIHELNRLFLRSLQTRDDEGLARVRFPYSAAAALRAAADGLIETLAEFPRALFRLRIEPAPAPAAPEPVGADARQILDLTILFCVWSTCRDSAYRARLFFGLTPREVHVLRTTPVSDLPRLALGSLRLECAFADSAWLWREMLTETRPEVRRQLVLVALQPPPEVARSEERDRVADRMRMK